MEENTCYVGLNVIEDDENEILLKLYLLIVAAAVHLKTAKLNLITLDVFLAEKLKEPDSFKKL